MNKYLRLSLVGMVLSASSVSFAAQTEAAKNPISVHVLNLKTGAPSEGVSVILDKK